MNYKAVEVIWIFGADTRTDPRTHRRTEVFQEVLADLKMVKNGKKNFFAKICFRPYTFITTVRDGQGKKVAGSPPNSFDMVQNKTFELKHYMVFVKNNPPTGQITFWISPL